MRTGKKERREKREERRDKRKCKKTVRSERFLFSFAGDVACFFAAHFKLSLFFISYVILSDLSDIPPVENHFVHLGAHHKYEHTEIAPKHKEHNCGKASVKIGDLGEISQIEREEI